MEHKCKYIKPIVIMERLNFKPSNKQGWYERKIEGIMTRYHCYVDGKYISKIHKDTSVLSKGRRLTKHRADDAQELLTTIEFLDSRFSAKSGDELLKRTISMPSCIVKQGKILRRFMKSFIK